MASARIDYLATTKLGRPLNRILRLLTQGRTELQEFKRVIEKYIDDDAAIAADTGIAVGDVPLFRNLLAYAEGLLCTVAVTAVAIDAQSPLRELLDAMG